MKQFIYILSLIISVILTSCEGLPNGGMDINELDGEEVKMVAMATRGLIDESKSIGAFMYKGDKVFDSNANYKYNLQSPSSDQVSEYRLVPADDTKVLRFPSVGSGFIHAYYPYTETLSGANNTEYYIEDWNGQSTDISKYDLYVAHKEGSAKFPQQTLEFYHAFSRVEYNITIDNNCIMTKEALEDMTMTISNVNYSMSYDIITSEASFTGEAKPLNLIISDTNNGKLANAILPPEKNDGHHPQNRYLTVNLKNGKSYRTKIDDNFYFLANNKYVWHVYINDNSIIVIAVMDDIPYGGVF